MSLQLPHLLNKHTFILMVLALLQQGCMWVANRNAYHHAITQAHGQVAYNLYKHQSVKLNPVLTAYIQSLQEAKERLIEFAQVPANILENGTPTQPFPINDTIGYGVVLGTLWRITNSLKFIDIQIVQIMIFVLLMPFFYQVAFMLFKSAPIAWWCSIAQLLFLPLGALNVQPVRDVWAYYALLILLYLVLKYLRQASAPVLLMGCILFSCLQWIRPTVFLAVFTVACVLLLSWLCGYVRKKDFLIIVIALVTSNIVFFWIPFMVINYHWYGRAMVGPVGQDLVEGLGEFPNKWGYKLNDEWIAEFIGNKYEVEYGTVAFDDAAIKEFNQAFAQDRMVFFINMFKRIPDLIAPGLQWLHYKKSPYEHCVSTVDKIRCAFSSWRTFLDCILRHLLIRLFFLCGYSGMVIALYQRRYFELLLISVGIICAGLGKLPSHIEYRYLIPFYWGFSFFVGYAIAYARRNLAVRLRLKIPLRQWI